MNNTSVAREGRGGTGTTAGKVQGFAQVDSTLEGRAQLRGPLCTMPSPSEAIDDSPQPKNSTHQSLTAFVHRIPSYPVRER